MNIYAKKAAKNIIKNHSDRYIRIMAFLDEADEDPIKFVKGLKNADLETILPGYMTKEKVSKLFKGSYRQFNTLEKDMCDSALYKVYNRYKQERRTIKLAKQQANMAIRSVACIPTDELESIDDSFNPFANFEQSSHKGTVEMSEVATDVSSSFNPFANINAEQTVSESSVIKQTGTESAQANVNNTPNDKRDVATPTKVQNSKRKKKDQDVPFDDTTGLGDGVVKGVRTQTIIAAIVIVVSIPLISISMFSLYKIVSMAKMYVPVEKSNGIIVDGDLINYEDSRETDTHDEEPDSSEFIEDSNGSYTYTLDDIVIKWDSILAINPEIVAYVIIPNTTICYPVAQTEDNKKYLHTAFDGVTDSVYGTIFMNAACRNDFSNWNTILYGHNMKNGTMFKTVNYYVDEGFYKEHPEVWIITPEWRRAYGVISFHEATDCDESYTLAFDSEDDYNYFLEHHKSKTMYDTGVEAQNNKRTLTLSTCSGKGGLSRRVLVCQPLEEGVDIIERVVDTGTSVESDATNNTVDSDTEEDSAEDVSSDNSDDNSSEDPERIGDSEDNTDDSGEQDTSPDLGP